MEGGVIEEWKIPLEREMLLCLKEGVLLHDEHTLTHYKIEQDRFLCVMFARV
jgi:hypothetical protein